MDQSEKRNCCSLGFFSILGVMVIFALLIVGMMAISIVKNINPDSSGSPEAIVTTVTITPPGGSAEVVQVIEKQVSRIIQASDVDDSTLKLLNNTNSPENDPIELARRLGGISDAPVFRKDLPVQKKTGESKKFWVLDVDLNNYRQTNAQLQYITPHLYFWIENGLQFEQEELKLLADTFENEIYPTNREIFGSEWSPGVDNDVHLTILYARSLGGAAGYFSSTDSLTKGVEPFSNESEMFYLSADYTFLNSQYTYSVLAHELQHMIHWNVDRNETAWINEGLSELAVELNGYDTGGFSYFFAYDPDLQINFWPGNDQGDSTPHYGSSYLFMKYLMDRFGIDSIKELVSNQEDGLKSIDSVYSSKYQDESNFLTAEKIFQDWSIDNFIEGSEYQIIDSGYKEFPDFPSFFPTETLVCDSVWYERTVKQFGTDYIYVDCPGDYEVEITGNPSVQLLPVDPKSGQFYFWSNYGDSSDMTLSQTFDLTWSNGPINLKYWTWYDIEKDYDYLYLLASTDSENWEILHPASCIDDDPTGSNFGCGYNGQSNGWINESVDLSRFAGERVTLRFEYITDLAVNGDGFLIDDISIEEIGYFTDLETDNDGWKGDGFVRINNVLPQNYGFSAIQDSLEKKIKKTISLGGLEIKNSNSLIVGQKGPVIVINGLTRYSRLPAEYQIRITKSGLN